MPITEIRYFQSIFFILAYKVTPVRPYCTSGLPSQFWAFPLRYSVLLIFVLGNVEKMKRQSIEHGITLIIEAIYSVSTEVFCWKQGFDAPEALRALLRRVAWMGVAEMGV